jgi:hypothetical protein
MLHVVTTGLTNQPVISTEQSLWKADISQVSQHIYLLSQKPTFRYSARLIQSTISHHTDWRWIFVSIVLPSTGISFKWASVTSSNTNFVLHTSGQCVLHAQPIYPRSLEQPNIRYFRLPPWSGREHIRLTFREDGFGGLVVSMLASETRVRGFNPGRSRWIFPVR